MKVKPIFIVGLPNRSKSAFNQVVEYLTGKLTDYHVLVSVREDDKLTHEVFFEKDFNEVKYEELKEILKSAL